MKPLRRYQPNRKVNLTSEELYKLYWNDHLSIPEIAEKFNVTDPTILELMKRAEIPRRKASESIKLAQSKGRRCQDYPIGKEHPNWKGGRYINNSGYVLVWTPNYPRAYKYSGNRGYVLEHILVWEQYHNQILPSGWHIHHLNGIKTDNRPENLKALPRKVHYQLIPALKRRIKELEVYITDIDGIGKKRALLVEQHFMRRINNANSNHSFD